MVSPIRQIVTGTALAFCLLLSGTSASFATDEDEYWGGYWRWYDTYHHYYMRPHPLQYSSRERTLYYGHSPPQTYTHIQPGRSETGQFFGYQPILGPGHYYGPPISPYYAPGRDRYGGMKYGWW